MPVKIRSMTDSEFEIFRQWSVENHAKELMEERGISEEAAMKEAAEEVAGMLPEGLRTEHHFLMTIVGGESKESAGFLWTIHEETAGRKQSFLCDFAVWEPKRRKGYGAAALNLMERNAAELGCRESVLFVADHNTAARALYEKCGYRILRQAGCGKYMIKELEDPTGNKT